MFAGLSSGFMRIATVSNAAVTGAPNKKIPRSRTHDSYLIINAVIILMKKINFCKSSLIVTALLLASISCTREPVADRTQIISDSADSFAPDDDFVQHGWVRVKLSEENASAMRVGTFTRGELNSGCEDIDRIAAELGATEVRRVFSDGGRFAERRRKYGLHLWYDIKFDDSLPVTRAVEQFQNIPGVQCAEPIYIPQLLDNNGPFIPAEAVYTPSVSLHTAVRNEEFPFNDPEFGKQWHYYNDGTLFDDAVAGADINLLEGWKYTAGRSDVIVVVGDFAIQYDHPDLADNMWINEAELYGEPGVDDDGNGYIDDIYGWNVCTNTGTLVPGDHGTHVAGTIAAVNNNGIGVCGIAGGTGQGDGVRLMSVQIYTNSGVNGSAEELFPYAADNGAVISQNSCGYPPSMTLYPQSLKAAINYFIDNAGTDENGNQIGPMKGGIVVASAGNEGVYGCSIPASDPDVVAVTSLSHDFKKTYYANYHGSVDIIAPGGLSNYENDPAGVYSTLPNDSYGYAAGTSMACPHVSGVAALIVSMYGGPGFTADQCKEILFRMCRPVSDYIEEQYLDKVGVGLVDAGLIALKDSGKTPDAPADVKASISNDTTVNIELTVPADGNGMPPVAYLLEGTRKGVGKMENRIPVEPIEPVRFTNYHDVGQKIILSYASTYNIGYDLQISVVDRFGNLSEKIGLSAVTGDYENNAPHAYKTTNQIDIPYAGQEYAWVIDLNEYFFDEDEVYGDVLVFSISNRSENIIKTDIDGSLVTFTPIAKGSCNMIITASDLSGDTVSMTWVMNVKEGPEPIQDTPAGSGNISMPQTPVDSILTVGLESDSNSVSVDIYDMASRNIKHDTVNVSNNSISIDVSRFAAGMYQLIVNDGGSVCKGTFVKR